MESGLMLAQTSRKTKVRAIEKHLQGHLIGGLAPLGPLDQGDHPVKEGLARIGGNPDDDRVGNDRGPAGYGASVASRLAYHRSRFAGYGRFVHQCRSGDNLTIAGDQLMGLHEDIIVLAEQIAGHQFKVAAELRFFQALGLDFSAGLSQRSRARLATAFRQGLGKGGKDDGQPEPEGNEAGEPGRLGAFPGDRHDECNKGNETRYLHAEHDRVAPQGARVEFLERFD